MVQENILLGVEPAGAEVVGTVVRVTRGKDFAEVVGRRVESVGLFVDIVDDGEVRVGVDELASLFFCADALEDLLLFGGAEGVPQSAAGSVAVDELTTRCEELPKVVIQCSIHKINNLT